MASLRPTKSPSTPGANWIFLQREYIRRTGGVTKSARRRAEHEFAQLRRAIQAKSTDRLKADLAALQVEKFVSTFRNEKRTCTILSMEAELAARKLERRQEAERRVAIASRKQPKPAKSAADKELRRLIADYERQIIIGSLPAILEECGEEVVRPILLETANRLESKKLFKRGADTDGLVNSILFYANRKRAALTDSGDDQVTHESHRV